MIIEKIKLEEIPDAGNMIKKVFNEFAASDYSENGVNHFYKIVSEDSIRERFLNGAQIMIAKSNNRITGYMEIINVNHIYLLFVTKEFQRTGIAGKMLDYFFNLLRETDSGLTEVTVNSTPYAAAIYERLGFRKIADFQLKNGIISFPMSIPVS